MNGFSTRRLREWPKQAVIVLAAAGCLLSVACGRDSSTDVASPRTSRTQEIEKLRQDLADCERRFNEWKMGYKLQVDSLQQEIKDRDRKLDSQVGELEQRLRLKDERIAELEQKLLEEQKLAREARAAGGAAPPVSVRPAGGGASGADFPVNVVGLKGGEIVTGTRVQPRYVETEETYRDDFGNVKKVQRREDETVNEYAYGITFSIVNLTATEQHLSIKAGLDAEDLVLKAGETREGVSLKAAKGAALLVTAGGLSRSFPVE